MANAIEILFLGLSMFVGESGFDGRHVVLPAIPASITVSTPRGTTCVEPHFAYISAHKDDVEACDACEQMGDDRILRVTGHHITVGGLVPEPFVPDKSFVGCIPKLTGKCSGYQPSAMAGAATLDITTGRLTGHIAGKGERRTIWKAEKGDGSVVFSATKGGVTRTMTLKPGASEVMIGNQYANYFGPDPRPLADNHWLAFYAFAQTPVVCDLPETPDTECMDWTARASHVHDPAYDTTIACSNSQYP